MAAGQKETNIVTRTVRCHGCFDKIQRGVLKKRKGRVNSKS